MSQEKEKMQRPAGMSREAFALLDGSHPVVPSLADGKKKSDLGLKEKRKSIGKGTVSHPHRLCPFTQCVAEILEVSHAVLFLQTSAFLCNISTSADSSMQPYKFSE